jgi:UDP-N-acetylglucosamine diphosphorylase/glucosamine-1-phosphate N-acetyltransferase
MRARVILFEDLASRRFAPLTHTRPVYELRCGMMTLRERLERALGGRAALLCRPYLARHIEETSGRRVNRPGTGSGGLRLLVNGRLLDPSAITDLLTGDADPGIWWNGRDPVAALLTAPAASLLFARMAGNDHLLEPGMLPSLPRHLTPAPLIDYPWRLVLENGPWIARDVAALGLAGADSLPVQVHRIGDASIVIGSEAVIEPGALLDTRGGPIVIGRRARVAGLSRIEGPAVIGAGSQIAGGRIRGGTTIGPACRLAGEIEASIFHGRANKAHDGFIGHSYVGEWVNLGAMTTNSDLKNTYGSVRVWCDGRLMDTGEQKVGALIGDHAKTGIGSLLDTGAVLGTAAAVHGGSALLGAKWIPSFAWGAPPKLTVHDPVRALGTMEEVMRRRGVTLTRSYRTMIETVFERTEDERRFAGLSET